MLAISYELLHDYISSTPCVIDANSFSNNIFQNKMDCDICRELRSVPEERNISTQIFSEKYAYSGVPVLIKDAAVNWTAMSTFSFKFFKQLYTETEGSMEAVEDECQFFEYQTEFSSLKQVFNMSDERASFQQGEKPWYVAWSNCHKGIAKTLRSHYQKPYFLPEDSESIPTDWIFLGGSGPGANMHLDEVQLPSWQAQISGRKSWRLLPSPECYHVCSEMNVTVEKGDILVLDTNMWFHSTFVHPGEISIAIGAEYD
ncbi:uncharacterized protein LOC112557950 [Pomacea canaliculata]|uniref:uncharacterized protein LOC112557950 n=1 Tax=Pomacea canaliculata TaxID=400727 RepID=UPI000D73C69D|nr:uncharacterized protein LOC112557950 [Pomacea canaliculata]XP_025083911.1 uncharacterized protein LOC112557950 [Pomacea canaliculata]XP_025083921.1 uncharacterized protein LOC112557950 [Pomacea canaliculata]